MNYTLPAIAVLLLASGIFAPATAQTCGQPPALECARVKSPPSDGVYLKNTPIDVEAKPGYAFVDTVYIQCNDDGTWKIPQITCITTQCSPPTNLLPTCGKLKNDVTAFDMNTEHEIVAIEGFTLGLPPPVKIKCNQAATWEAPLGISCTRKCAKPRLPDCAEINGVALYEYGVDQIVTIKAKEGYKLMGDTSLSCAIDGWLAKNSDGTLRMPSIMCEKVAATCPPPQLPFVVKLKDQISSFQKGKEYEFVAMDGYILKSAPVTIKCNQQAQWEIPTIEYVKVAGKCSQPQLPMCVKPVQATSFDKDKEYEIVATFGYKLLSSPIKIKCNQQGAWEIPDIDCVKDTPDANPSLSNMPRPTASGFACQNGKWIPDAYVCDRWVDCSDGSDERNCSH